MFLNFSWYLRGKVSTRDSGAGSGRRGSESDKDWWWISFKTCIVDIEWTNSVAVVSRKNYCDRVRRELVGMATPVFYFQKDDIALPVIVYKKNHTIILFPSNLVSHSLHCSSGSTSVSECTIEIKTKNKG